MNPNLFRQRKYTFLVNESGESGIENVHGIEERGASPYMTLGGVLIPSQNSQHMRDFLRNVESRIGKKLHCKNLNHTQKRYFARELAKKQILCFGVISFKHTLGIYREEIERDNRKFYNKCAQYLLERLGHFMTRYDVASSDVNVVFEDGNYDYGALRNLIRKCRNNPMRLESRVLEKIIPEQIYNVPKTNEPLLTCADLVAHSLYKVLHRSDRDLGMPEFAYVEELSDKFYSHDLSGKVLHFGVKPVHSLSDLNGGEEVERFLRALKTPPRPRHD